MRFFRRKKTEILEDVAFEVIQEHPALAKVESEERPFGTLPVKIGDSPALLACWVPCFRGEKLTAKRLEPVAHRAYLCAENRWVSLPVYQVYGLKRGASQNAN